MSHCDCHSHTTQVTPLLLRVYGTSFGTRQTWPFHVRQATIDCWSKNLPPPFWGQRESFRQRFVGISGSPRRALHFSFWSCDLPPPLSYIEKTSPLHLQANHNVSDQGWLRYLVALDELYNFGFKSIFQPKSLQGLTPLLSLTDAWKIELHLHCGHHFHGLVVLVAVGQCKTDLPYIEVPPPCLRRSWQHCSTFK